jgi:hypothetical protein
MAGGNRNISLMPDSSPGHKAFSSPICIPYVHPADTHSGHGRVYRNVTGKEMTRCTLKGCGASAELFHLFLFTGLITKRSPITPSAATAFTPGEEDFFVIVGIGVYVTSGLVVAVRVTAYVGWVATGCSVGVTGVTVAGTVSCTLSIHPFEYRPMVP